MGFPKRSDLAEYQGVGMGEEPEMGYVFYWQWIGTDG
jgi:hypothetical protein